MTMKRMHLILPALYLLVCAYLIATQGLFGESFIVIILGFPWSFMLAFFEFFHAPIPFVYALVLAPIALNAMILWWIGSQFGKRS